MKISEKIVLASASPRRQEILNQVGLEFDVIPSDIDEDLDVSNPAELVKLLATNKAMDVLVKNGVGALVIGADTVVAKDGVILGKPKDEEDAFNMLSMLQGKSHQVYTGYAVAYMANGAPAVKASFEATNVNVCAMSPEDILEYISTGEPMDKAGAYGIQGRFAEHIAGIEGDYYNVVGLPISKVTKLLREVDKEQGEN